MPTPSHPTTKPASHTPGPWKLRLIYENQRGSPDGAVISDESGYGIAFVNSTEANARLIAAAPSMFAALYPLAILAMQSDRYRDDAEFAQAVDTALAAYRLAEGRAS